MAAQTSWVSEVPGVNHIASFEIEDTKSAQVALDSTELCGKDLPWIIGTSAPG